MAEQVECRSDLEYADTPLAFVWQGQRLEVEGVIARARTPRGKVFRVMTVGSGAFELTYDEIEAEWSIQSAE